MTQLKPAELKSYTGTYIMYLADGYLVITGREKFKNFKAVFSLSEVNAYLSHTPPATKPKTKHCGNMSSDGNHYCNYRQEICKFTHTHKCKDYVPCGCEYCNGEVTQ